MNSGSLKSRIKAHRTFLVCLLLTLGTVGVYWQVRTFDLTNYDDFSLVGHNPRVAGGLTPENVLWALTTSWYEYWHPLTWLSHMLDCQLFGMRPGWHHLVNLGFHLANTLLLFLVLCRMTCALWRSAMVAALFALHPLHVESVVWVAERKDVLSAFFFMLTLWAYVRYVEVRSAKGEARREETGAGSQRPEGRGHNAGPEHASGHSPAPSRRANDQSLSPSRASRYYAVSVLFFACGLMSKPMLVTLPFVLLLLDYWPLNRVSVSALHRSRTPNLWLVWEKLPFFALALLSCVITYSGAKAGNSILSAEKVPWGLRLANVPVSYVRYLGKMLWPANLTALYPMPDHWALWQVVGAVLALALITAVVVVRARAMPYLVVGWLLFLGMLVPTIGLVVNGFQSIADRYTYLPYVGLFVAVVWGIADFSARWRFRTVWLGGGAAAVLLACAGLTWVQAGYWRDSFTLWPHCLKVDPDNAIAHFNLGCVLQIAGHTNAAAQQYLAALRTQPDDLCANLNLGAILCYSGRAQEATNYFTRALKARPNEPLPHADMGYALRELGHYAEAVAACDEAIRLAPNDSGPYVEAGRALSAQGKSDDALRYYAEGLRVNPQVGPTHYYLGLEWLKRGNLAEAVSSLGDAVRLVPGWPEAHFQLAVALATKGDIGEALAHYRVALRLKPESSGALNNLAWILATCPQAEYRNGDEAVELARRACELTGYTAPGLVGTLAAAYAEAGRWEEAVASANNAHELALAGGQKELGDETRKMAALFAARQPFRETTAAANPK